MSNKQSNFPSNQLSNLESGTCSEITSCLMELSAKGKPANVQELRTRINDYFRFCVEHDFRCGIESLSLSLGVSRQMFWKWTKGEGCDAEWSELCQKAKQMIVTYLEAVMMSGRLSPPSAIFLLKNVGGYKDTVSFEDVSTNERPKNNALPAAELPKLSATVDAEESNTNDTYEEQYDYLFE